MSTREEFTKRFPRYAECIENPQGHRRGKDLADAALAGFEAGYQAATSRQDLKIKTLVEALMLAVQQNSLDMLMTGEEIRLCEVVIAAAKE